MSQTIHFTVYTEREEIIPMALEVTETLENLKALLEVQTQIRLDDQIIFLNNKELKGDSRNLLELGVKNNDFLLVQSKRNFRSSQNPEDNPQALIDYVKNDPNLLKRIITNDPALGQAIISNDVQRVSTILLQRKREKEQAEMEAMRKINELNADPFNPEAQKQIFEQIRMENINQNWEQAIEHIPESFARVNMLYIDCSVNNIPVKAFVDTGAQQTIMSLACAERCGIERLIDRRYSGIAKGVGTAEIIGRVHLAPIKIGNSHFPCSFTILKDQSVEFLLGLDMMRRHQCSIDLKEDVLKIGEEKVRFLAEKDIPKNEIFDSVSSEKNLQTTTTPSTPSQPSINTSTFSEESVKQLMGLGFSRDQVLQALKLAQGNAELAAAYLFG